MKVGERFELGGVQPSFGASSSPLGPAQRCQALQKLSGTVLLHGLIVATRNYLDKLRPAVTMIATRYHVSCSIMSCSIMSCTHKETAMSDPVTIPGYTYGTEDLARSPISLDDLDRMKTSVLFGEDDIEALRASAPLLEPHIEEVLDVWYGFVGSQPHLLAHFSDPASGTPVDAYLNAVRLRFGQWIRDTAAANYDQAWLDYQFEIGRRHHPTAKNATDGAVASRLVPLRDLILLTYPITATLKPFLAKGDASAEEVERMHQAWLKSVLIQVVLWSQPYVRDGEF